MLGPYAIAHLKVALALDDDGLELVDPHIYLTDTLQHEAYEAKFDTMKDAVAVEGEAAVELKSGERFSVLIGNPPYDREQRDGDEGGGKRKGGVVRYGVPGIPKLIDAVLKPMSDAGLLRNHARSIYNDYVYFWRWATWQATQLPEGPGVVAFITASSYLRGVSMGGLRAHFRDVFDELWIVDLGGDGYGAGDGFDENVFDIRTPVAIAFGVRTTSHRGGSCEVRHVRVLGSRMEKFDWLGQQHELGPVTTPVPATDRMAPFAPSNVHGEHGTSLVPLTDLLSWTARGIQFSRTWPVGETRRVVQTRWKRFVSSHRTERPGLLRENGDTSVMSAFKSSFNGSKLKPAALLDESDAPDAVERVLFRSFDRQWCLADRRVVDRPRPALWRTVSDKQVFLVSLVGQKFTHGPLLTCGTAVPDLNAFNNRGGLVLPLWRDASASTPNLAEGLLEALSSTFDTLVSPEDFAAYLYACLGTGAASDKTRGLGTVDGPLVPITIDKGLFERAVALGRDLLWWHTWGERFAPAGAPDLPGGPATETVPIHGYPESYGYDPAAETLSVGTGTFAPVPEAVWDFEVSGLKPLQSWLGYRMAKRNGKKSSPLDDIRPTKWTFTDELLQLIAILDHTVQVTPAAAALLDEILAGDLIEAANLPKPTEANRKPPKA